MKTGTGSKSLKKTNGWEDATIRKDGNEQPPGTTIQFNSTKTSILEIVSDSLDGEDIRLAVVDSQGDRIEIKPEGWVRVIEGVAEFTVTPKSLFGGATLILYAQSFAEVLEFPCIVLPPPHPWYFASSFFIFGPSWFMPIPHLAIIPVKNHGSSYTVVLHPQGDSLLGKEMVLKVSGTGVLPVVTPTAPQVMKTEGIAWKVYFSDLTQVAVVITSPTVDLSTGFTFVPSSNEKMASSGELDYQAVLQEFMSSRRD
ncbi:hypothetical protein ACYZT9_15050 [Pseudomonas sp. ZT5P21]